MGKRRVILAVDHGTSGVKASLVTTQGRVLASDAEKTEVIFLPGGGAEQDPRSWWDALVRVSRRLVQSQASGCDEIEAVCVSSTFSTTVAIDEKGDPVMNALTWMDSRGAPHVRRLMGGFPSFMGYSIPKALRWVSRTSGAPSLSGKDDIGHVLFVMNEMPRVYEKTRLFLPSKDYLNMRLTGERAATFDSVHLFWLTDVRDLARIRYDKDLVRESGIDPSKLPPLVASTDVLGHIAPGVADEMGLRPGVKVVAGSPDHQCACIGSAAVEDYQGHLYVGTSSWVQCLVPFKKTDVLHSIASFPTAVGDRYQAVNEQDMAGGALGFLAGLVNGFSAMSAGAAGQGISYNALDEIAKGVPPGSRGVVVTPWLNGERTPVDDMHVRAGIHNLSTTTTAEDIVRAFLEGVALNTRWSLKYVERFVGRRLDPLTIVGGGASSDVWCRIFADCLGRGLRRPPEPIRANARGAAFIAAVALKDITFSDIPSLMEYEMVFEPERESSRIYDELFDAFVDIYRRNRGLYRALNG